VPVVFNGGGQREIVEHGRSGFLIDSAAGLRKATLRLIQDPALLRRTASAARRRSDAFSVDVFREKVAGLFDRLETEYRFPS
jgi:glycosyltransferase involved in cell wall biosynthesis